MQDILHADDKAIKVAMFWKDDVWLKKKIITMELCPINSKNDLKINQISEKYIAINLYIFTYNIFFFITESFYLWLLHTQP